MEQNQQEVQNYQEEKNDLRALFNSLVARRFLIAGLTGFITILAVIYTNTITIVPTYQAISTFKSTDASSIVNINSLIYINETKSSILSNFFTAVTSRNLQKDVFNENDFLTKFNQDNNPIGNVDGFIDGAISSIRIINPNLKLEDVNRYLVEKPYSIAINGTDAEAISDYLDILISRADSKNIMDITKLNQQKINIRLDQLAIENAMLLKKFKQDRLNQIERIMEEDGQKIREINDRIDSLKIKAKKDRLNQIERIMEEDGKKIRDINDRIDSLKIKAKKDRLNQIKRIKEEDGQKITEINDQINRARYKAKQDRLSKIAVFTDAASLAKSLGIIKNNFTISKESDLTTVVLSLSNDLLPEWYLYGETALLESIKLLDSRTSDDPFIPELVTLNNQINTIQNNNLLKTLESRQDDSPFIPELVTLNLEKDKLKSNNINLSNTSSINIVETAKVSIISGSGSNKRMIVFLAFIVSLMLSILLVLIMNLFKLDEKNPG